MKIKICGLTNYKDAEAAVKLGADYIGFIFAESPRRVTVQTATDIINRLNNEDLMDDTKTVGVFVNEKSKMINEIIELAGLDIIQLHGDEDPELIDEIEADCYKAFRIGNEADIEKMVNDWDLSRYLIDTKVEGVYGGTGKKISSELALIAKKSVEIKNAEFFLAGGINPENCLEIVNEIKPFGIDISSGIESSKGKKDIKKMKMIFEKLNR